MSRIVYEDAYVTEYDNGDEQCRFTDREWEVMLSDPAFGYVCHNGHRLSDADHRYGACLSCEHEAEYAYYEWLDSQQDESSTPVPQSTEPETDEPF